MSKFDIKPTNDPNYTGTSQRVDRSYSDKSMGSLFSNIGDLFSQGIQGVDTITQEYTKRQADKIAQEAMAPYQMSPDDARGLEQERQRFKAKEVPGLPGEGGGDDQSRLDPANAPGVQYNQFAQVTGETASDANPPSDTQAPIQKAIGGRAEFIRGVEQEKTAPANLEPAIDNLTKMAKAYQSGDLAPLPFAVRAGAALKALKAQFPGYSDVIDHKFQSVTGINPANMQIRQTWAIFDQFNKAGAGNAEANKNTAYWSKPEMNAWASGDKDRQAVLDAAVASGSLTSPQSRLAMRMHGASSPEANKQAEATKAAILLNPNHRNNPTLLANAQLGTYWKTLDENVVKGTNGKFKTMGEYTKWLRDEFSLKGKDLNHADSQFLLNQYAGMLTRSPEMFEKYWNEQREELKGPDGKATSLAQYWASKPEVKEQTRKNWDDQITAFGNAIKSKDGMGLLTFRAEQQKLTEEWTSRGIIDGMGGHPQYIGYLAKKMGLPDTFMGQLRSIKDEKTGKFLFQDAEDDGKGPILQHIMMLGVTGKIKTIGEAQKMLDLGQKPDPSRQPGVLDPRVPQMFRAIAYNPDVPVEARIKAAQILGAKESTDITGKLGKPQDYLKVLGEFASPQVMAGVAKLPADEQAAHSIAANRMFVNGFIGKPMAGTVEQIHALPRGAVVYNEKTAQLDINNQFAVDARAAGQALIKGAIPGSGWVMDPSAKESVATINLALKHLRAANPNLSDAEFSSYAKHALNATGGLLIPRDPTFWSKTKAVWDDFWAPAMPDMGSGAKEKPAGEGKVEPPANTPVPAAPPSGEAPAEAPRNRLLSPGKRSDVPQGDLMQLASNTVQSDASPQGPAATLGSQHASLFDDLYGTQRSAPKKPVEAPVPGPAEVPPVPRAGTKQDPMTVAKSMLGWHENTHTKPIAGFIKTAMGKDVDPVNTPWCAGFVNGVLHASGYNGTNSLMARSFLNYGKETTSPKQGDIVVLSRGQAPYGHVGFYAGPSEREGYVKVLGGNQGNKVSIKEFPEEMVLGYRRFKVDDMKAALPEMMHRTSGGYQMAAKEEEPSAHRLEQPHRKNVDKDGNYIPGQSDIYQNAPLPLPDTGTTTRQNDQDADQVEELRKRRDQNRLDDEVRQRVKRGRTKKKIVDSSAIV